MKRDDDNVCILLSVALGSLCVPKEFPCLDFSFIDNTGVQLSSTNAFLNVSSLTKLST